MPFHSEQNSTVLRYKQQCCIRYRLEAYVGYSFGEPNVVSINFSSPVRQAQLLSAVSSEQWYCICLSPLLQKSFYSTVFSCCRKINFNRTDYYTIELASAAKLRQCSLRPPIRRKRTHFHTTRRDSEAAISKHKTTTISRQKFCFNSLSAQFRSDYCS